MYSLIIKPRAILMTKDAYDWYEEQRPGLGEEFLDELDGLYSKLSSHPGYFGKIKKNFRVSPSINWSENGPDGPGYYGKSGNETIKMSPGRSN